ncbi:MAG TPA: hypothetical protein PLX89_20760 [Verrucomicrobiota bacterium]|nr:hypothetical protein [Verrucomicrobiales bacterium]HRI15435.1 hypothetical protein [Verrucomicrobiota bacterium]
MNRSPNRSRESIGPETSFATKEGQRNPGVTPAATHLRRALLIAISEFELKPPRHLRSSCALTLLAAGLLLALASPLTAVRAHEHLAAGATLPEAGAALLFVNAGNFAAESGYVFPLELSGSGPYAGVHHAELSFVCQPGTLDYGGPAPFHPALGAHIEAVVESVSGPVGGAFGFWESPGDEQVATELTFSVPVGTTNGTHRFPVSENDGSPGADPYGHVHGRVYSATMPGLYAVGFRFVDTSTNGPNGGPLHVSSERFFIYFQAGITLAITNAIDGAQLTFATANDHQYVLESLPELVAVGTWTPVGEPFAGDNRLRQVTVDAVIASQYFRLRREP